MRNQKIVDFIEEIAKAVGKPKKEVQYYTIPDEIDQAVREYADKLLDEALDTFDRATRQENQERVQEQVLEHFQEIFPDKAREISDVLYNMTKEKVRAKILEKGVRPDGRKLDEIRPIWCETSVLPRARQRCIHAGPNPSAVHRDIGHNKRDVQRLEGLDEEASKDICTIIISPLLLAKLSAARS